MQFSINSFLQLYIKALAGYEKTLGLEHADTIMTVNNLAAVLWDQRNYHESKLMYERALIGNYLDIIGNYLDIIGNNSDIE